MRKFLTLFSSAIFLMILVTTAIFAQNPSPLKDAEKWFSAWELISKDFYKIKTIKPVEFLFFDEKFVYSTSEISVPDGERVEGPKLFGKKLIWKRAAHDGKLKIPDGQIIPAGLMSFAAPLANRNAFFVMPLLDFWRKAGVESKEFGLENLVTGVFLHEFSHSQQMQNFGRKMSEFETQYKFETDFNDDILQNYFEKNSEYSLLFKDEVKHFYDAAAEKNKAKSKFLTTQAIEKLRRRQNNYFTGEKAHLKEIDDFFLTMEGFGQFSMYLWLTSPKGGNFDLQTAQKGVRRGGKFWSQEEGLALFLILNKFAKPALWAKMMTGEKTVSIFDLIEKEIR